MAISDCKVAGVPAGAQASNFTMDKMGNRFQPDVPNLSADEMKAVMDELSTNVLAPAHNKLVTELAPLESSGMLTQLDGHNVVTTSVGADGGDIPTISALSGFGGGDMLAATYCTGTLPNANAVDHALLADDADLLEGNAAAHFATASDLSDLSQTLTALVNAQQYQIGETITLTDVCCPGVIVDSKTKCRFCIALDKAINMTGAKVRIKSTRIDVYADAGSQGTAGNLIYSGGYSMNVASNTVSKNIISTKVPLLGNTCKTDKVPVVVVGTFNVYVLDTSAPDPN